MNRANPTPALGAFPATNPCGEQPLLPYESCTLGSVNLSRMVRKGAVDDARLAKTVHQAVHFLDNVIEINCYPLPKIAQKTRQTRKIGIGIMGFADMLVQLNLAYDSDAAEDFAGAFMTRIRNLTRGASAALGRRRSNFPAYPCSCFDRPETPFMRNATTTTTIAPTGSISILADCSGGVEPIFAVAHRRRTMDTSCLNVVRPLFLQMAKAQDVYSHRLADQLAAGGSVRQTAVPATLKRLFRTASEIPPRRHVRMQAAFQKFTDNAVSKAVNLPWSAAEADVREILPPPMPRQVGCRVFSGADDGQPSGLLSVEDCGKGSFFP